MKIPQIIVKALRRMAAGMATVCRGKRGKEGPQIGLPVTKRAIREPPPSSLDSVNLAETELRRQDQFNCTANIEERNEDEETSPFNRATPSIPDPAKQSDVRMLEVKLHSCQLQLYKRDLQITILESNAMRAEQVRVELEARVAKMQQQLCKELEGCGSYADGAATPFLLESSLNAVQITAASFAKAFFEYAKAVHIHDDFNCILRKHFENVYLTRPGHVQTYLLKAWVFESLFQDFENENFTCGGTSIFLDPTERRLKSFEYFQLLESNPPTFDKRAEDWFEEFRRQKLQSFLSLWQSDEITVANLSIDALENPGAGKAEVRLMESFRAVAKAIWSLHKLSFSFETRADIFRVSQETELHADYMDSVVSMQDDERFVSKVGFMICPGFRIRKSVLKCQIYLAAGVSPSD